MMKSAVSARIIVGSLFVLVLFTAFAFSMANIASTSAKDRFLKTQEMLSRAQASNIQAFFEDFGTSVSILAQSPSVERRDTATVEKMDTWVSQWGDTGLVGGVVLTDAKGIVRFISNVAGTRDVGASLADRDYFLWASEQESEGEYFVGTPVISRLGASKDESIIPVASPVVINGVFSGVIAASVKLNALTGRYVTLMKLSDTAHVHVMSSGGELLYGTSETHDEMILELAEDILNSGAEGSREMGGFVVSFTPIPLVNEQWWLVMMSPAQEMANIVRTIYVRQMTLLPLALVTLLVVWFLAQKRL